MCSKTTREGASVPGAAATRSDCHSMMLRNAGSGGGDVIGVILGGTGGSSFR